MAIVNYHVPARMGVKIGANGQGELEEIFGVSTHKNHAWFFSDAPINIWAKFKPFIPASGDGIYEDHFTAADGTPNTSGDRYVAAAAANFGLTAPANRSTPAATLTDSWVYTRPVQGQNPLRALDFEYYYHHAPSPIVGPIGDIEIIRSQDVSFDFTSYIGQSISGADSITWGDLTGSVGNMYLCAVFAKNSGMTGTLLMKTSSQKLKDGATLELTTADLTALRTFSHYYLCARSVAKTNLLDSETSASYRLLPTDNGASDVLGQFTVRTTSVASITIDSVATGTASPTSSSFVSAANFIGPEPATPSQSQYFKTKTTGVAYHYLHLKLIVVGGTGGVNLSNLAISLSHTYFSENGFRSQINCSMKDSNFNAISSLSVPAGTTKTFYLIVSAPILSLDAKEIQNTGDNGNQRFSTRINLYQNGVQIDNTNELRVRNYDF